MSATSAVTPTETFTPRRSPWNQVLRGDSLPPPATLTSSSIELLLVPDASPTVCAPVEQSFDNVTVAKRSAWKNPSNGAVAVAAAEIGPVMGADSWPALSKSTKASGKFESLKSSDVDSVPQPVLQGTAAVSPALSSQGQPNPSNMVPSRQRSMKRYGGGGTSANGSFPQPLAPPLPVVDMPLTNHSTRDTTQRSGFVSHNGSNHHQRNAYRNRMGGPHPRGDGSHHHNYVGRRDQDRSNQDWNAPRSFVGRDAHLQHTILPRFMAPPPPLASAHFLPQSSVRHFGGPIAFPEQLASPMYFIGAPPPESLRGGIPFVGPIPPPPPPAVYIPAIDRHLDGPIVAQVDYYFSNENLVKDTYLRQNMDDQGWVSIKFIAGFKKLKFLTENIQLIRDAVQASTLVEVQGDKIRRRNDWMKWIMPPAVQFSHRTNPQQSGMPSQDMLTGRIQGLNLDDKAAKHSTKFNADPLPGRSESGEFNSHSKQSSSEGTSQFSVPAGSGQSGPAIN